MTNSSDSIRRIVIVGGGTAGWLTAAVLSADMPNGVREDRQVTLIESPDIPTVGVGEGTWPSMMGTLRRVGISEKVFIEKCHVSLKQGSRFCGWSEGKGEYYDHPFSEPVDYGRMNLAEHWLFSDKRTPFAYAVSPQPYVCDKRLAPKQKETPEYAYNLNYGYHLDAGEFSELLKDHCVNNLGVTYRPDEVIAIESKSNGDLGALALKSGNRLEGDLFIDCTGLSSLLLGKHYRTPWVSYKSFLFNDTALAIQVPYVNSDSPIASQTLSTAFSGGWIWDIGLSNRRGVGVVYSSDYVAEGMARSALADYLEATGSPITLKDKEPRMIQFEPGRRSKFWKNNCVAIGLSSGFVEPLEATALVLVEQSAHYLREQIPNTRKEMDIVANRFNERFSSHWDNIVEFLKLHYVLSKREDSAYWRDHRSAQSMPKRLSDSLVLWRTRAPWVCDSRWSTELFSSASYQYVLYGMCPDWTQPVALEPRVRSTASRANEALAKKNKETEQYLKNLPSNRKLVTP